MRKKKTIFVVEDSEIIAKIIRLELKRKFHCKVFIFEDGDDVLNQVKVHHPDLIVLDYRFDNIELYYKNSLELLIDLRKNYKTPVIVFSGQHNKEKAVELIREGANDYISKDENDFMETLLASSNDIFEIQSAKSNVELFIKRLKINFVVLGVLIVLSLVGLKLYANLLFQ
jgi:DNA-binding NtrC family response regulator